MRAEFDAKALANQFAALPEEERVAMLAKQRKLVEDEHEEFADAFRKGQCYLCGNPLTSFNRQQPCVHWLLKPEGFSKSDFPAVSKAYGLHEVQNFLRWVASEEKIAANINDMPEEGSGKLIETSIRYRDLDWAFSC